MTCDTTLLSQVHALPITTEGFGTSIQAERIPEYGFYILTEKVDLPEHNCNFGWVHSEDVWIRTRTRTKGKKMIYEVKPKKGFTIKGCCTGPNVVWDGCSTAFLVGRRLMVDSEVPPQRHSSTYRLDIDTTNGGNLTLELCPYKGLFGRLPDPRGAIALVNEEGTHILFVAGGYSGEWGNIYDIEKRKWSVVDGPYGKEVDMRDVFGCFYWKGKVVVLCCTEDKRDDDDYCDDDDKFCLGFQSFELRDENWIALAGDFKQLINYSKFEFCHYGYVQVENVMFAVGLRRWIAFDLETGKALGTSFRVEYEGLPNEIKEASEIGDYNLTAPYRLICLSKTWHHNCALIGLIWRRLTNYDLDGPGYGFHSDSDSDNKKTLSYFVKVLVKKQGDTFTGESVPGSASYFSTEPRSNISSLLLT